MDERELRNGKLFDYVMLPGTNGQPIKTAVIPDAIFLSLNEMGSGHRFFAFSEILAWTVTVEPKLLEKKGWSKDNAPQGSVLHLAALWRDKEGFTASGFDCHFNLEKARMSKRVTRTGSR